MLSVFTTLPILGILYERNQIICDHLCLILSLSKMISGIHPYCNIHISMSFLFSVKHYSIYEYSTYSISIHQSVDIWDVSSFRLLWCEYSFINFCVNIHLIIILLKTTHFTKYIFTTLVSEFSPWGLLFLLKLLYVCYIIN